MTKYWCGLYDHISANARALGTYQGDAIRNITGTFGHVFSYGSYVSGAFSKENHSRTSNLVDKVNDTMRLRFDASNVVPTSIENRPVNVALHYRLVAY